MFALVRRSRHPVNVWPAFVDVLASLVLAVVFVLLVFVLGNVFLSDVLSGRDRAVDELTRQVRALADTLSLERAQRADLQATIDALAARLEATIGERDAAARRIEEMSARTQSAESDAARLRAQSEEATRAATAARDRIDLLNQQIAALREQLARLATALDASESRVQEQKQRIADLGERLNVALARRVDELQRYRSEFFGRLREVLGEHPSIRIVGDRFVFQSELLFPTASAELVPEGKRQLTQLARTLKTVTRQIPPEIDWVLRIDGHTDRRPIRNAEFASNWELSTARALSVVRHLIEQDIPPQRLAAAGFGEFQPVAAGATPEAYARNRRIEIKLTQP